MDDKPIFYRPKLYLPRGMTLSDTARVYERDIPKIVEVLAPYAYKWREIGTYLGFTQHELNNIQSHPMTMILGPIGYLTAMLNEWVQWTKDGPHHEYARFVILYGALASQTVNLGEDAEDVCSKIWDMRWEREPEEWRKRAEREAEEWRKMWERRAEELRELNYSPVRPRFANFLHDRRTLQGVRKMFGAAREMTVGFIKKALKTLNLDVMVTRKYKKRHDKYTNRDVTRWWFQIWGDEAALKEMELQWEREVAAKHQWRLETCPVVTHTH